MAHLGHRHLTAQVQQGYTLGLVDNLYFAFAVEVPLTSRRAFSLVSLVTLVARAKTYQG